MNLFKLSLSKLNLPPGTAIYTGINPKAKMKVIHNVYDKKGRKECIINNINELRIKKESLNWVDVVGAVDSQFISKLGVFFDIHNLFIEDILNTNQNIKIEFDEDDIFICLRIFTYDNKNLTREQVSIYLSDNIILTFQEGESDIFKILRDRLEKENNQDKFYILFLILDFIFDKYHILMSQFYDQMEKLELNLFDNKNKLEDIYDFRVDTIRIKSRIWQILDLLKKIKKNEDLDEDLKLYYDDIENKMKLYYNELKYYEDKIKSLIEIFVAISSEKMNKIMKILTIISSIFIPLSFIVGLYGMNFEYMPGLEYKLGFHLISFIMFAIAIIMLVIFKIKKWM